MIRVQKYLSQIGICSRRKGEEYIKKGLISINGQVITKLGTTLDPENDIILLNNQRITDNNLDKIYIALNKPKGFVTSCKHPGQKLVIDLIDIPERIYPIGRLDKDSSGLILLTNDGEIHNRLIHPSFSHEKEYEVIVKREISDKDLNKLSNGVNILGTKTRPASIKRISKNKFRIILLEGKNRQIRRMIDKIDNKVIKLKRIRVVNIKLGKLSEGSWRYLNKSEINKIRKITKL